MSTTSKKSKESSKAPASSTRGPFEQKPIIHYSRFGAVDSALTIGDGNGASITIGSAGGLDIRPSNEDVIRGVENVMGEIDVMNGYLGVHSLWTPSDEQLLEFAGAVIKAVYRRAKKRQESEDAVAKLKEIRGLMLRGFDGDIEQAEVVKRIAEIVAVAQP